MKYTVGLLLGAVATCSAFTAPLMMATRAVVKKPVAKKPVAKKPLFGGTKKVAPVKKPVAKKPVAKKVASATRKAPPASQGYPSFAEQASKIQFKNINGGPNRKPPVFWTVPDFSDPKTQKERDPEFYKAAALTRKAKITGADNYVYDDGLTALERRQRATIPTFLTGSAKSQSDESTIRDDIVVEDYFGNADRFQLAFISVFGLIVLVGSLSGTVSLD